MTFGKKKLVDKCQFISDYYCFTAPLILLIIQILIAFIVFNPLQGCHHNVILIFNISSV